MESPLAWICEIVKLVSAKDGGRQASELMMPGRAERWTSPCAN
ncbi:MAG: hypothetical protein WA996_22755 [Candidatus Promineifilaceae bacterium]